MKDQAIGALELPTVPSEDNPSRRANWAGAVPFLFVHVAAVAGVVWLGFSWSGLLLAVALYFVRMFGVTAGYHRYFSHRSFRTSRAFQCVLALLAMSSVQKGVLWWASHHRLHHKLSDKPGDVHSVVLEGFYWSHVGWILSRKFVPRDDDRVRDLTKYPELVFLDRHYMLPAVIVALGLWLVASWWGLVWGFFVSTTLLWHGTFTINSLAHVIGRRRYRTSDNSKNSMVLALLTMGEGWHNNHHYYQRAANQGFFWWEVDATYYVLRFLAFLGIVWDVHTPPPHVLAANRIADSAGVAAADAAALPIR